MKKKRIRVYTREQKDQSAKRKKELRAAMSEQEHEDLKAKNNARRKELMTEERKAARRITEKDRYYSYSKEYHAVRTKRYRSKLKTNIINAYGGCCSCCGERHHHFLTLDHKNNDGNKHRASLSGEARLKIYREVRDAGYPDHYTILCFNCNIARSLFGVCPHQVPLEA